MQPYLHVCAYSYPDCHSQTIASGFHYFHLHWHTICHITWHRHRHVHFLLICHVNVIDNHDRHLNRQHNRQPQDHGLPG